MSYFIIATPISEATYFVEYQITCSSDPGKQNTHNLFFKAHPTFVKRRHYTHVHRIVVSFRLRRHRSSVVAGDLVSLIDQETLVRLGLVANHLLQLIERS
jgi:hypothetical protein